MIREFRISINPEVVYPHEGYSVDKHANGVFFNEVFYIDDFISKYFRKNKVFKDRYKDMDKSDKSTSYVVLIESKDNKVIQYKDGKSLVSYVDDKYEDITSLRGMERTEKILDIILKASKQAEQHIEGIQQVIEEAIQNFRDNEYKHIWTHQKKRIKGRGNVKLICELSMFEFTLNLLIEAKDEVIFQEILLTTEPDSLNYYQVFKSLVIEDNQISVTDRIFEKPFYTITFEEIASNKKGTFIRVSHMSENEENEWLENVMEDLNIQQSNQDWWQDFKNCIQNTDGPCPKFD
jgi:DNA-binding beta-propeller fold protein YncE